ncbi:hypothetical protein G5V58_00070 [Nocardioides anomalus]|uniref:Ig-like domain repeat protein n=1 Tax=Nocardioides anomalus TaxID=2712223 RepID=A0A6G6W829_9ACTN|nr:hypothetical protein [Nocardioides anomalus]QIG41376.1 hypothetical protein G5V58_00070 [Nocardioides anomalus]
MRLVAVGLVALTALVAGGVDAPGRAAGPLVPRARAIELTKAERGVQPTQSQRITAKVGGGGKVRFVLKGAGVRQEAVVKAAKRRAVYDVPLLAPGRYTVKASYRGAKARTRFEVYDSAITVSQTAFTVSAGDPYAGSTALTGAVRYRGKPGAGGYVDVYLDGNRTGGVASPDLLGFAAVAADGTFSYPQFASRVALRYGVGTWAFQGFYTSRKDSSSVVASPRVVVTVTP